MLLQVCDFNEEEEEEEEKEKREEEENEKEEDEEEENQREKAPQLSVKSNKDNLAWMPILHTIIASLMVSLVGYFLFMLAPILFSSWRSG